LPNTRGIESSKLWFAKVPIKGSISKCAVAGKHIYCEKPMGISLDEAHQINFDLRGHFLDCIEKKVTLLVDTNWGLKVMAVTEAIFESIVKTNK
jgi:predicted dehydrogenase